MEYKIILEKDLIYLASLIDGEGSIFIRKANGVKNPIHTVELEVSMTHKPTIEKIYSIFELGSFRPVKRKKQQPHHKQAWKWAVSSNQAITILELIHPYMITKKEEAELAITFKELKTVRSGRAGLPASVLAKREALYWKMKELKKVEYEVSI